jgi:hypothetical protein
MEKRLVLGFLNIIKLLVAGIIVLLAVWQNEYKFLLFLLIPAIMEVFSIVIIMDKNEKL